MLPSLNPVDAVARVNREVERAILRSRYGIRGPSDDPGPRIGATPKDVVWRRDKAELWHDQGDAIRYDPPLVSSTASLAAATSSTCARARAPSSSSCSRASTCSCWIGAFLTRSTPEHARDVRRRVLPRAIRAMQRVTGRDEVTLAGYCLGGTFAILYAAAPKRRYGTSS